MIFNKVKFPMILRRFIRNSSILYPLYVKYILRNDTVDFPDASTELHLTGFPRSANTYCYNILKVVFPSLILSYHIHTTASIKLALKHRVPTLVLVRDPISACCSLLLKNQLEPSPNKVESLLNDYIEYYEFVLSNKGRLKILKFEDVVSSPGFIVSSVCEYLKFSISSAEIEAKAKDGQRLVEAKESLKAIEGSSLPNETRKKMKRWVEGDVESHPMCSRANALYESIIIEDYKIG